MVTTAGAVLGFAVAYCLWRWGLRNDNWLEGGVVALAFGVFCGLMMDATLRVRARAAEVRAARAAAVAGGHPEVGHGQ